MPTVQINGNLIVAKGAVLNDYTPLEAEVDITGNVLVRQGVRSWAWATTQPRARLGPDTWAGSIVAINPLTLDLGQSQGVAGNVISIGGAFANAAGGSLPPTSPSRTARIGGNLIISGLRKGGWLVLRHPQQLSTGT